MAFLKTHVVSITCLAVRCFCGPGAAPLRAFVSAVTFGEPFEKKTEWVCTKYKIQKGGVVFSNAFCI